MSDVLKAAAEVIGAPEELVKRSADARSEASGGSVDDILAAWAGGAAVAPSAAAPSTEETPSPPDPSVAAAPTPAVAQAVATPAPTVATSPPVIVTMIQDPKAAPLVVGVKESPKALVLTVLALLAFGVLAGAILPAMAAQQEARDHTAAAPSYSAAAIEGHDVYLSEGCATCHTMSVRSILVDAGLGLVTEPEDIADFHVSTEGVRRIGPDLAHVGSRMDPDEIGDFLANPSFARPGAHHTAYSYLSETQLDDLTAFLSETK